MHRGSTDGRLVAPPRRVRQRVMCVEGGATALTAACVGSRTIVEKAECVAWQPAEVTEAGAMPHAQDAEEGS